MAGTKSEASGAAHSQEEWDLREATPCDTKVFYRVLRKGETPRKLRTPPPEVQDMSWKEQRYQLLEAIAWGNVDGRKSPYFHCTNSLTCAKDLWHDRGRLYSDILIRFPQTAVAREHWLAWTDTELRIELVNQLPSDSDCVRRTVQRIQGYMTKDKEVVMKTRPKLEDIDYWNGDDKCWRPAVCWEPRGPVFGGVWLWVVGGW